MCNMKRIIPSLAAAILFFCPLAGQDVREQSLYRERAGWNTQVFRGKAVTPYTFRYNGTFYWSPSGFEPGEVMYNGKRYSGISVNIDAFSQQLVVCGEGGSTVPIYVERDQVAWFTKGGSRFVNLRYMGVETAEEGFYRLLYDGTAPFFERVDKLFESSPGDKNGDIIGYHDPAYDEAVITFFRLKTRYFSLQDGILVPLRGKRDLVRLYKDRRRSIRQFASSKGLDLRTVPMDIYGPEVMAFIEKDRASQSWFASHVHDWHEGGGEGFSPALPEARGEEKILRRDLAAGFFDPEVKEDLPDGTGQTVTYQNKVYEIGVQAPGQSKAGKLRVTGSVRDAQEGAPIPGVVIWDEKTSTYVRSDGSGRYSITLPAGDNILHFSEYTKEELALRVILLGNGSLDVVMPEKITTLTSAIISAESMASHRTTKMGLEKVSMKTISKIPSAFGEGDVLKAVLTLPGVKSVGEASSGFNVRGGASDQNLILFNDNTIYNPSHMFGIFSSFNPDIVENVELYKSSIPAEYGGRISSVLNIRGRDGSMEKVKGSLGLGILTSRFHLEGPLAKGKTSFLVGGRTTYSDWLLKNMPKNSAYADGTAGFSDVNLALTHRFDDRNTLQASGYWATDRFAFSNDTTFRYRNLNVSLLWTGKTEEGKTV